MRVRERMEAFLVERVAEDKEREEEQKERDAKEMEG